MTVKWVFRWAFLQVALLVVVGVSNTDDVCDETFGTGVGGRVSCDMCVDCDSRILICHFSGHM